MINPETDNPDHATAINRSDHAGIMDNTGITMSGHILIRDCDSGEVLVNTRG